MCPFYSGKAIGWIRFCVCLEGTSYSSQTAGCYSKRHDLTNPTDLIMDINGDVITFFGGCHTGFITLCCCQLATQQLNLCYWPNLIALTLLVVYTVQLFEMDFNRV